jgi:hypothetical protein
VTGCGNDISTAPGTLETSVEQEVGEMPLPVNLPGLSTPAHFSAEMLGHSTASLTWKDPGAPFTAVIAYDGQELARVNARNGEYVDGTFKDPGNHTYTICFVRGPNSSDEANAAIFVAKETEFIDRRPQHDSND